MNTGLSTCTDSAMAYINCDDWLSYIPSDGEYFGTIVVMDSGLSVAQWKDLESQGYGQVDIIGVLSPNSAGGAKLYDDQNRYTDADLKYKSGQNHGFQVLSALGLIARGAKVIFVNIDLDELPVGQDKDEGFHLWKEDAWKWIYYNRAKNDINVISISLAHLGGSIQDDEAQDWNDPWIKKLRSAGIFIAAAMGNDGKNTESTYLTSHPDIFGVGSIDHENRGDWRKTTKRIWGFFIYILVLG